MKSVVIGRAAIAAALLCGTAASATTIVSFRNLGEFDFSAPGTADYTVVIAGAAGGNSYTYQNQRDVLSAYGGAGAIAFGSFHLDAGTLLQFNVGARGRDGTGSAGGGGGAATTFFTTGQILQMIAGGGGGAGYRQDGLPGGYLPSGTTTGDAAPGTTGAGGQAGHSTFIPFGNPDAPGAGGGAGLYTRPAH